MASTGICYRWSPSTAALAVPVILLLVLAQRACGHGFLLSPQSRNIQSYVYDNYTTKEYTPQGLNGGGVGSVSANSAIWPNGGHSACGDASTDSPQRWMSPSSRVTHYVAGQTITLQVVITANHKGRFSFSLCTDTLVSNECFQRSSNQLTRADAVFPGDKFWYLTSPVSSLIAYPSPNGPDAFSSTPTYQLQFALPPGVTCTNCVLQWYYTSGNSCTPPCDPADPNYDPAHPTTGCDPAQVGICGSGPAYPEEFWNCADISISAGPNPGATPSPSLPPPPPTLQATPSPSPPPPPTAARSPPSPPASTASCATPAFLASFCTGSTAGVHACSSDAGCTTFINCAASGQGYLQSCSAGLRFNPALGSCDWPQNVQCGALAGRRSHLRRMMGSEGNHVL